MNYLKSALAGFGMSFIGTALCGAKIGMKSSANSEPFKFASFNIADPVHWNIPASFITNNIWSIPTARLGAAYHDNFGRSATDKFNKFFNTDISPYILDGIPFAILGSLGMTAYLNSISNVKFGFDKPWVYFTAIMEGYLIGCTAALGAYCGDETPKIETHDELTANEEIQDIDFIL